MKLAVIGTGYVGLVSGTCFAEMGNRVICVDNDMDKLEKLNNNQITIYEPGLEILFKRNVEQNRLHFTDDLRKAVLDSEIIFLCLPTPQDEDGSADLKHVFKVADNIGEILSKNEQSEMKIIVNKSTVPVGTAASVKEIIESHKVTNFEVVSNPEFLREGFAVEDFMKPDRIIIGANNPMAMQKMKKLYEPFVRQGNPILEMDTKSAEVTKYAANSYLAMRITFMNELANFCEAAGANVDLVRKGMGTDSRIGKRFLFPGIGYGGSCFPKDVKALVKTSTQFDSKISLLELVDKLNEKQKHILVKKIKQYYNNNLKDKNFAVWGLAFKPNTDDMREAPSIVIINDLLAEGANIEAYDPEAMDNAKFYLNNKISYASNMYEVLKNKDALLIFTEWNEFRNPNFKTIEENLNKKVIFDGRNIYDPGQMEKLGFVYFSIGRQPVKNK